MFDSREVEAMGDQELIDAARRAHGAAAFAQAAEITAVREVYRRHRARNAEPGVGGVRAGEFAAAEVAAAVQVSEGVAAALIDIGLALDSLPETRRAFAAGRIDLARVQVITDSLRGLTRVLREALEPRLIDVALRSDPGRLRQIARRWLIRLDPYGEQRRREERENTREVRIRALQDGMAVFDGLLPAVGAQTLARRLREMSLQVCENDPRTMSQRRADALVALADGSGRLRCRCGRGSGCPQADAPTTSRRPLIQVGISAETLLGLRDDPAYLSGFGPVDAALARTLAEHARFQVIPEYFPDRRDTTPDPARGLVTETATVRPFSGAPAREVRAVDGFCRFPGCTMAAAESVVAQFDLLPERVSALSDTARRAVLCTHHHRLKQLADKGKQPWRVYLANSDRLRWVDPSGETHETVREGARYLFPHTDIDAPASPFPAPGRSHQPERPSTTKLLTVDLAYPVDNHILIHPQLSRATADNDLPDAPAHPAIH